MDREQILEATEIIAGAAGALVTKYRLEILTATKAHDAAWVAPKVVIEHFVEAAVAPFIADYAVRALEHLNRRPLPSPMRRGLFTVVWAGYIGAELLMEKVVQPALYDRPIQVEQLGSLAAGSLVGLVAFGLINRWARARTLPAQVE